MFLLLTLNIFHLFSSVSIVNFKQVYVSLRSQIHIYVHINSYLTLANDSVYKSFVITDHAQICSFKTMLPLYRIAFRKGIKIYRRFVSTRKPIFLYDFHIG